MNSLDNKIQECSRCVLRTVDDPETILSSDELCNHCHNFDEQEKQRKLEKTNLPWVIYNIKKSGRNKQYDCLVGLSGGVDSSTALHYAVQQGLRPLCFSMDNGFNTVASDENIMRLIETLKVPFYRYVIDLKKFRELYRSFIKGGIKNLEATYDHILSAVTYELASKHKIKYVITGGNITTEGIMPISFGEDARDLRWIKSVYKQTTGKRLSGLPLLPLWKEQYYRLVKQIKFIPILDFYEYNRNQAKQLLKEKYSWIDYGAKHEENRLTQWFQNWYLPKKFGLDKRRPHLSSLINSKQITKEQALKELSEPFHRVFIDDFDDFMRYAKKSYNDYPNSYTIRQLVMKTYRFIPKKWK